MDATLPGKVGSERLPGCRSASSQKRGVTNLVHGCGPGQRPADEWSPRLRSRVEMTLRDDLIEGAGECFLVCTM
jgi:hypothetical protein